MPLPFIYDDDYDPFGLNSFSQGPLDGGYGGGGPVGMPGGPGWEGGGGKGPAGPSAPGRPSFNFGPVPNFTPPNFNAPTFADAQNEPGYQFRLKGGADAMERSAAARGSLRTGGTLKNLQEYGQSFAAQEYGNVFNR